MVPRCHLCVRVNEGHIVNICIIIVPLTTILLSLHRAVVIVGETSEAIGVRTPRDTRKAGVLMANTGGLFGALAGKLTRHVTGPPVDHTVEMPQSILKNSTPDPCI